MKKMVWGIFLIFCMPHFIVPSYAASRHNLNDCVAQLTADISALILSRPSQPIEAFILVDTTKKSLVRITGMFRRQGLHIINVEVLRPGFALMKVSGESFVLRECLSRNEALWAGLESVGYTLPESL